MKTTFYLNDKKISKKEVMKLITPNQLKEAKEDFRNDPYTELSYWVGGNNFVRIEFN